MPLTIPKQSSDSITKFSFRAIPIAIIFDTEKFSTKSKVMQFIEDEQNSLCIYKQPENESVVISEDKTKWIVAIDKQYSNSVADFYAPITDTQGVSLYTEIYKFKVKDQPVAKTQ